MGLQADERRRQLTGSDDFAVYAAGRCAATWNDYACCLRKGHEGCHTSDPKYAGACWESLPRRQDFVDSETERFRHGA